METLFVHWDPNPILFHLGPLVIRWYGLLWVIGLALSYWVMEKQYKMRGISEEKFEPLFLYAMIGIIGGARLGHCIFYEPGYYLTNMQHFIEMFLPIKFTAPGFGWDSWKMIGYAGLASHGGTLGLIISLALYCRKTKLHYMDVVDMIAVATPVTAGFIRTANLMNSEIVGNVTNVPWAFEFVRSYPGEYRHPAQLYEALAYFLLFGIQWWILKKYGDKLHRGFMFGFCLTYIFTFRFFIEFLKKNQEGLDQNLDILNMGQLLSIPFVLIGLYCMFRLGKKKLAA